MREISRITHMHSFKNIVVVEVIEISITDQVVFVMALPFLSHIDDEF